MPTIEKRISDNGEVAYRARVRVKGYLPQHATFKRKTDADRWAQRTESDLRENRYFPSSIAKKRTVADLINSYQEHLKLENPRRHEEVSSILAWWRDEVGQGMLSHFTSEHVLRAQQKLMARTLYTTASTGGGRVVISLKES